METLYFYKNNCTKKKDWIDEASVKWTLSVRTCKGKKPSQNAYDNSNNEIMDKTNVL